MSLSRLLPKGLLILSLLLLALGPFCATQALAQEHEEGGTLDHTVPTAGKTGISLILANLYNEHRLAFALVVTLTMAVLGIVVGELTDLLLKILGVRRPRKH